MLSGEHETVPTHFIQVDRSSRIRREVTEAAILEKMESISRIGLIHALVITREGLLVSGETRFIALQRLGWTGIPIQWADTLDARELLKIELEENIKRTDLSWQDQCDALRRFHAMQLEEFPEWSQAQTGEAIGIDQTTVSRQLLVAEEIASGNVRVLATKEYSTALGIARRQIERKVADELSNLKLGDDDETSADGKPVEGDKEHPIQNVSFLDWLPTYSGPSFNLIHCDFPYGIGADKFNQGSAGAFGGYEDTPDTYWSLVRALCDNKEKLLGSSGHIIFWFSMRYYAATLEALQAADFWVDPYPLIWHKSDNKGTLPDPERGPRRVYEVAFLCSHGDRKIISSVSNTFAAPTVKFGEHMSEKSEDMLAHFMRMMVDENTRMLDPTCGSGSALRAADRLGAGSVLGLEMNPEFAENARRAWDGRAKV
jgi:hypothetical protein